MIKHNYEADKKRKKNEVRTLRKVEKQVYDAAPSFARKINKHQIKQFSEDLKAAKTKNRPMLIDLLEGNECKPIVTQDITLRENRNNILKDHNYCCHSNRKRQDDLGDAVWWPRAAIEILLYFHLFSYIQCVYEWFQLFHFFILFYSFYSIFYLYFISFHSQNNFN